MNKVLLNRINMKGAKKDTALLFTKRAEKYKNLISPHHRLSMFHRFRNTVIAITAKI